MISRPWWNRLPLGAWVLLAPLLGCNPEPPLRQSPSPPPEPAPVPDSEIRTSGGPELRGPPLLSSRAATIPDPPTPPEPGLAESEWLVADYGNPANLLPVVRNDGPKPSPIRLALELYGGSAYATVLTCEGSWTLKTDVGAQTVLVIYNDSTAALQGSLAFSLSPEGIWTESRTFVLKPGWNTIRIDQGEAAFKTEATRWQHTARLSSTWTCYTVALLFHNGRRTGRLFIDGISVACRPVDHAPSPK